MSVRTVESKSTRRGLGILETADKLRNYVYIEKAFIRISAGWFLQIRPYSHKYKLAYHLYDHCEHVTWMKGRLEEMRGGRPNASVRPEINNVLQEIIHAPDEVSFLNAFYGVVKRKLLNDYRNDLLALDPSANANEYRLFERIIADLDAQLKWYEGLELDTGDEWSGYITGLIDSAGGFLGSDSRSAAVSRPHAKRFERPKTILVDDSIELGELVSYEEREEMNPEDATIEQFRVFFNELFAASLLASVIYDASEGGDYPWEFFEDFCRQFWDEARHSEFGAIRLKELGQEPDRCNPVLFELSENMPVLHRVAYLTRGLEAYFMPRKPKRLKEYQDRGDTRSQLFADHDWSDEISHVRYGTKWVDYLLDDDFRTVEDVLEEVKDHLSRMTGKEVKDISAPF